MSDKFNVGGGAFSALSKIFDVLFLSILWLIFCIPIITIGPSTTALYYTTAKVIRKDRGYVWHEFWLAFKTNLVTGAIYTVVLPAIIAILFFAFNVTEGSEDFTMRVLRYVYIMIAFIVGCGYSFMFPVLSRFSLPRFQMFKMSFLLAIKHLPTTLFLMILLLGAATVLWYIKPLVIFVPTIISWLCSLLIEIVFKKYLPKPEEDTPEEDLKWYQTF